MKKRPHVAQTSLPDALTRAHERGVGFAYGFTGRTPIPQQAPPNIDAPAVATDFRQHKFTSRSYFVGTDVQVVAGANELRRFIAFQNNGAASVFLAFGVPAKSSGDSSFILPANGYLSFEFGIVPNNEIYAVSTVSVQMCVIEGCV